MFLINSDDSADQTRRKSTTKSDQAAFQDELLPLDCAAPGARCPPFAPVVGRRLRQEDAPRGRDGGGAAIVQASSRGPPADLRSRVAMAEPLAPFQTETISLSPLIPPHTHLLPKHGPGCSFTGGGGIPVQNWSGEAGCDL